MSVTVGRIVHTNYQDGDAPTAAIVTAVLVDDDGPQPGSVDLTVFPAGEDAFPLQDVPLYDTAANAQGANTVTDQPDRVVAWWPARS